MSVSVNLIHLIGNVGRDAYPVRAKSAGVNFTLATTYRWGKEKGKEETTWHNISFFAPFAESLEISKGDLVYVEGRYRCNKGKDGKLYFGVMADVVRVLAKKTIDHGFIAEDEEQPEWADEESFGS